MVPPNPVVELLQHLGAALLALIWLCLFASVAVALLGSAVETVGRLELYWQHRHTANNYGPQWERIPPQAVTLRVAWVLFLTGALLALLHAAAWLLAGGWTTLI